MRLPRVFLILLAVSTPLAARAQMTESPPPGPAAPRGPSQKLPEPDLPADSGPADFLRAARGAIATGRLDVARSALEMAQTRLLSRTVAAGREREPSDDLAVKQIAEAIGALAARDREAALRYIDFAAGSLGQPLD